ncbi:agmatinase [Alteribacillus sp. HJP-4]|uniref:agmatinase n=1 Tax=Alteribacillus sp. HJP-4 TaxID=2775394 RepID=UPI0035CD2656
MDLKYTQDNTFATPRFSGVSTFMRLHHVNTLNDIDFMITGIPFDTAATFRTGTRFGPQAVRNFSSLVRSYSYFHKIGLFEYLSGVDFGDVPVVPGSIHDTYANIEKTLTPVFEKGIIPISVGGDHSITLGELRAAAKKYGPLALVQFDAHCDTTDEYFGQKYTHGTPFRRAVEEGLIDTSRSIQVGIRGSVNDPVDVDGAKNLGYEVITGDELLEIGWDAAIARIKSRVGNYPAFLTFDVDFVDPSCAPGTGTPEVGGLLSREAIYILRRLTGIRFIGFDVVEILPSYDHSDITSALGANVVFEMAALIAVMKKEKMESVVKAGEHRHG